MKKILILIAITIFASNFSYAQKHKESALEKYARVKLRVETSGDVVRGVNENYSNINVAGILKELKLNQHHSDKSPNITVAYTFTGASTIYDFVSNGTPCNVIQDPNNANRIHFVEAWSPYGDSYPDFSNRRVKYYYSTNKGANFYFINNVPDLRSGFPHITLAPNGNGLITSNVGSGDNETVRWYYDAAPGLGSLTELYPAQQQRYLFGRNVFTSALSNPTKFISVVSSYDLDSVFRIACTSLSPSPGTFSPANFINAKPFELYCIARGDDGRIGLAYIVNNLLLPSETGDIYFMESTNYGTSFGNPTKIFDANISPAGDSLAAFRGISMVYQVNAPKIVFETVKQTTDGYYFPGVPAKIRFWSNSLPGSDPNRSIVIADTSRVPFRPFVSKGTNNDAFAPLCRPTIGKSVTGNYLYVSFMTPGDCAGGKTDSCSFMNIWFVRSTNSGTIWNSPNLINYTFPRLDFTYPCISPSNDYTSGYENYFVNMTFLLDTIPGSYVNHPSNNKSFARFMFIRTRYNDFLQFGHGPYFTLLTPLPGSVNVLLNPKMSWSCSDSISVKYRVQISTEQTFQNIKFDTVLIPNQVTVPSGKLNIGTKYYWRVCVGDTLGYSDWSYVNYFTTRTTGINTISTDIPKEYKLFQNYPNPFNPSSIIRFQIKDSRFVNLKVYDVLGKEIATLVNEKLNAGEYEVPFSISQFSNNKISSGIYFYKLEAGNFTDIKKCVLIK